MPMDSKKNWASGGTTEQTRNANERTNGSPSERTSKRSHETPSRPWQYVAADLFELEGKSYLVTSDYFSDIFELDHLRSISSVHVIRIFRHGIPEQLVTDNAPQFVSRDFLKFLKE